MCCIVCDNIRYLYGLWEIKSGVYKSKKNVFATWELWYWAIICTTSFLSVGQNNLSFIFVILVSESKLLDMSFERISSIRKF